MTRRDELEVLRRIATPTRVARAIGEEVLGRPYNIYPWILYLEQQILAMLARPGREIMAVSVSPQQGKSSYCAMWLPFWYLGLSPTRRVLLISYSDDYSASWSLRVRNLMQSYGPSMFQVAMSKNLASINNWRMAGDIGGMLATGILGGITGHSGDLIIIDDVIKTMEDAGSPTILKKHIAEWDNSVMTRLQENSKVLIIATRWAEGDLIGTVIQRSLDDNYSGVPVHHVNIKAMAEPDDPSELTDEERESWRDVLGRKEGEYLEGQHSPSFFQEKQGTPGAEFTWFSLYQGMPTARVGGMFPRENWQYYDPTMPLPEFVSKRRVWDLAATEGGGDWTVGVLMGKTAEEDWYVLDVQRFQRNADDVLRAVKNTAWLDTVFTPIRIEEERAGAGKSVVAFYRRELLGYDIDSIRAEADKESRATPYSRFQNAGKVFLPRGAGWVEKFIVEHGQMMGDGRRPRHDDQIDVSAYAVLDMFGRGMAEIYEGGRGREDLQPEDMLDVEQEEAGDENETLFSGFRRRLEALNR